MNRKEQMISLRNRGYSYGQIGRLFKVSRQRVHQITSGYQVNLQALTTTGKYKFIHEFILDRDEHKCQKCGAAKKVLVHHIDGDNNRDRNLITLCQRCHLELHRPQEQKLLNRSKRIRDIVYRENT